MKFEVGEIAIYQNAHCRHELNGTEVMILGVLPASSAWHCTQCGAVGKSEWGCVYVVRWPDGDIEYPAPHKLRKKSPPEETTTWDKCVWRPREYA